MRLASRAFMSSLVDLISLMETRPTSDYSIITDGRDAGTLTEGAGARYPLCSPEFCPPPNKPSLLDFRLINARLLEICE